MKILPNFFVKVLIKVGYFSDNISDSVKEQQIKGFYEFAAFRLDVKKRRLLRGDEIVPLTPKEFEVLLLLVENAGRVVELQ